MSLDPVWMLLSLVFSGFGFVLFRYGKKQDCWPRLVAGLAFMLHAYSRQA